MDFKNFKPVRRLSFNNLTCSEQHPHDWFIKIFRKHDVDNENIFCSSKTIQWWFVFSLFPFPWSRDQALCLQRLPFSRWHTEKGGETRNEYSIHWFIGKQLLILTLKRRDKYYWERSRIFERGLWWLGYLHFTSTPHAEAICKIDSEHRKCMTFRLVARTLLENAWNIHWRVLQDKLQAIVSSSDKTHETKFMQA